MQNDAVIAVKSISLLISARVIFCVMYDSRKMMMKYIMDSVLLEIVRMYIVPRDLCFGYVTIAKCVKIPVKKNIKLAPIMFAFINEDVAVKMNVKIMLGDDFFERKANKSEDML